MGAYFFFNSNFTFHFLKKAVNRKYSFLDSFFTISIVNPKRPDSTYPFNSLAGVGVTFKVLSAIVKRLGLDENEYLKLAQIIESTDGNGKINKKNANILNLYATGQIDFETAVFAIQRNFN